MGRSLEKNAYNLGLLDTLTQVLEDLGFSAADLFETEPDAGLGNAVWVVWPPATWTP